MSVMPEDYVRHPPARVQRSGQEREPRTEIPVAAASGVLMVIFGVSVVQGVFAGLATLVDPVYWEQYQALGVALVPGAFALLALARPTRLPQAVRCQAAALVAVLLLQGWMSGQQHPLQGLATAADMILAGTLIHRIVRVAVPR